MFGAIINVLELMIITAVTPLILIGMLSLARKSRSGIDIMSYFTNILSKIKYPFSRRQNRNLSVYSDYSDSFDSQNTSTYCDGHCESASDSTPPVNYEEQYEILKAEVESQQKIITENEEVISSLNESVSCQISKKKKLKYLLLQLEQKVCEKNEKITGLERIVDDFDKEKYCIDPQDIDSICAEETNLSEKMAKLATMLKEQIEYKEELEQFAKSLLSLLSLGHRIPPTLKRFDYDMYLEDLANHVEEYEACRRQMFKSIKEIRKTLSECKIGSELSKFCPKCHCLSESSNTTDSCASTYSVKCGECGDIDIDIKQHYDKYTTDELSYYLKKLIESVVDRIYYCYRELCRLRFIEEEKDEKVDEVEAELSKLVELLATQQANTSELKTDLDNCTLELEKAELERDTFEDAIKLCTEKATALEKRNASLESQLIVARRDIMAKDNFIQGMTVVGKEFNQKLVKDCIHKYDKLATTAIKVVQHNNDMLRERDRAITNMTCDYTSKLAKCCDSNSASSDDCHELKRQIKKKMEELATNHECGRYCSLNPEQIKKIYSALVIKPEFESYYKFGCDSDQCFACVAKSKCPGVEIPQFCRCKIHRRYCLILARLEECEKAVETIDINAIKCKPIELCFEYKPEYELYAQIHCAKLESPLDVLDMDDNLLQKIRDELDKSTCTDETSTQTSRTSVPTVTDTDNNNDDIPCSCCADDSESTVTSVSTSESKCCRSRHCVKRPQHNTSTNCTSDMTEEVRALNSANIIETTDANSQ